MFSYFSQHYVLCKVQFININCKQLLLKFKRDLKTTNASIKHFVNEIISFKDTFKGTLMQKVIQKY